MVSFIPNSFIPSTQADASEISDEALSKSRAIITENSQRGQKWSLIAQIAMWSMFFIIGGATTGIINNIKDLGVAEATAIIGGAIGLAATIAVSAGLISNRIGTTNSFNQSEYSARTIAKEIEKLGEEKGKNAQAPATSVLSSATSPSSASPHIQTKGVEYLHALMDAPVASQKIN
ncbi:MAG: hypothetical protein U1E36_07695 [Rickettsiales bacterium]